MPATHGELAGNQCRTRAVTIFDHFQQIMCFVHHKRADAEVIEDQQLSFGELQEPFPIRAIAPCKTQRLEQTRHPFIPD